ncbi:MAG: SURF1 family cytochrome oxidase biogenesis protein [Erythrobacter sp.]
MLRRLPILPTIIVVAAAAVMVALGVWQLGRADEKAALIARYEAAEGMSSEVPWRTAINNTEVALFRRSTIECDRVLQMAAVAGTAANGRKGWAIRADCVEGAFGEPLTVELGFSATPDMPQWGGGTVGGVIAPGPRLVAMPPQAGLEPLAAPDPRDLPNNHLAYAGQWFFFALTALVIYWLAVRKRIRGQD